MLDLSFGLPIVVRDAALKMLAPGPESGINREYYAQENEREIEEGRGGVEAYEKTDEKARELLRRLANSEPYYKRQRRLEASDDKEGGDGESAQKRISAAPGPIRTHDNRQARGGLSGVRGGRGGSRGGRAFPSTAQLPPAPSSIRPPQDPNVTSLFITGVEDDLPEHAIRTFFSPFGTLRSVVCSHRAHCAFINYATRQGAEAAAEACQGKAVISGCPLRVQWGKPRPLDNMEKDERMMAAREGRDTAAAIAVAERTQAGPDTRLLGEPEQDDMSDITAIAPPPGQDNFKYASLSGD